MKGIANKIDISDSVVFRGGSMQHLTEDSVEKQIAGKNKSLDAYILRTVAIDPSAYYGCIIYGTPAEAERRAATLRTAAYHYGYDAHICWRKDKIYIIKAVDFDG